MTTSSIVFLSMAGIVAASDSDYSLRPLSKKFPGMIAVNIYSPIPWKSIIDHYMLENDSRSFSTLREAYDSFAAYFNKRQIEGETLKKDSKEKVLFMGYNEDDLYPSLIGADIEGGGSAALEMSGSFMRDVSHMDYAFYDGIGSLDGVSPILVGASDEFMEEVAETEMPLLTTYQVELVNQLKGSSVEKKWIDKIEEFDMKKAIDDKICESIQGEFNDVATGMDSFSIQEMVEYAEALINAEVRLTHLKNKEKGQARGTREIAVITIPEGLTWIKHHLYAI